MKRLILLVALVLAMAVLAPAAFADDAADEAEGADVEMEDKDTFDAQKFKAKMIADYFTELFDLTGDDVIAEGDVDSFRTGGDDGHAIGWGALFKLMLYAGSDGFDPDAVEGGWAIGQLRKDHDGDLHKYNLGQAHQASKDKSDKPEKTMPPRSNKDGKKHES